MAARKKSAAKKTTSGKKTTSKRELLDTGADKRFIRRGSKGRIKESDDVGKSLGRDVKKSAKKKVKAGQGDKGDQAKRRRKKT